jgi:hypothetical protein
VTLTDGQARPLTASPACVSIQSFDNAGLSIDECSGSVGRAQNLMDYRVKVKNQNPSCGMVDFVVFNCIQ